jgi:ABC-type glycerol-3-phosphate transport system substrate-binding protein
LLARNIGAIPSRKVDVSGNSDKTASFFKKTFVDELKNSIPEPNIVQGSEIRQILLQELQSAILKQKTAKEALDSTCQKTDIALGGN